MEAIEKLRTAARNMAKGRNLENHEECNLLLIIADEIEAEIAERYMELPKDADGVPVRIGDKMTNINKPNDEYTVTSITESGCRVYGDCAFIKTSQLRHVKPDPYKELLVEFAYRLCDMSVADGDLRRYAEKFRELGKAGA